MVSSIVIIFVLLAIVLSLTLWADWQMRKFERETQHRLTSLELDCEHLRGSVVRLNQSVTELVKRTQELSKQIEEIVSARASEQKAKEAACEKFKAMLQHASEQHIETDVVVVDLDKLSNGKDITNKPVKTSKVSVPGKVKKSKRTTAQPPHNHPTSTVEATVRNRTNFAELREKGLSVREAGEQVGVSLTTAKRYEKWRNEYSK